MFCKQTILRWTLLLPAVAFFVAGCMVKTDQPRSQGKGGSTSNEAGGHAHPHNGPHDGALAEWGEEQFHAEFTVDHGKKQATIYILDGTAKSAPKLNANEISNVELTIKGMPPVKIELRPDPVKTDAKGIAFSGINDLFGKEMEFEGTISGKIKDQAFSGDFAEKPHDHHHNKK